MNSKKSMLVFLALVLLFFFLGCNQPFIEKKFKYEWENQGILFQSNFKEPKVLLREFALKPKIIVVSELSLEKPNENPEIFNKSIIPFYTVVAGNDRNAIQLLMFVDKNVQECQTNFGNFKTQVSLTAKECSELIDKLSTELLIFFPLPDSSIKHSSIVLEENKITIKAKNIEEQAVLSRSLAEQLFPNAEDILDRAREKLKKLK